MPHPILQAYLLELEGDRGEGRQRWKERDPVGFGKQATRLRRFYEHLGFQPVGKADFMVFNLEKVIPEQIA